MLGSIHLSTVQLYLTVPYPLTCVVLWESYFKCHLMIAVFIWLQFAKECFPAMYIQVSDYLSAPDTTFLLSRMMMTWNIIKFKHGIKSMLKMRLSPHCFYENLSLRTNLFLSPTAPAWWFADVYTIHSSNKLSSLRWYRSGAACKWGGTEECTRLP